MRLWPAFLFLFASAYAQTYTISTFAGGALPINLSGNSASVAPGAMAVDPAGNVFFTDQYYSILRWNVVTSLLTLAAGNGTTGFSGDNGQAVNAQFSILTGVAVDSAGNLYIADSPNNVIRKVSNGVVTTVAGNGTQGYSGDGGPATSAQLSDPSAVAVDSAGNLYIADGNWVIRKVSGGVITTVAGTGMMGFSGLTGPATSTPLNLVVELAADSVGNLYFTEANSNVISEVSGGVISIVAGNGTQGFSGDNGPAAGAQLNNPYGLAVDSA